MTTSIPQAILYLQPSAHAQANLSHRHSQTTTSSLSPLHSPSSVIPSATPSPLSTFFSPSLKLSIQRTIINNKPSVCVRLRRPRLSSSLLTHSALLLGHYLSVPGHWHQARGTNPQTLTTSRHINGTDLRHRAPVPRSKRVFSRTQRRPKHLNLNIPIEHCVLLWKPWSAYVKCTTSAHPHWSDFTFPSALGSNQRLLSRVYSDQPTCLWKTKHAPPPRHTTQAQTSPNRPLPEF